MRKGGYKRILKNAGLLGLAFNLLAFSPPQKNDLIELKGFLYGRQTGSFAATDQNKLYVLKPGTRALIKEIKKFESGNYGLCLSLVNATDIPSDTKCVWAYFNTKTPYLNLYSVSKDETSRKKMLEDWAKDGKKVTLTKTTVPEKAQAAQVTRTTTAVVEKQSPAPANPAAKALPPTQAAGAPGAKGVDAAAVSKSTAQGIAQFNAKSAQVMTEKTTPACVTGECAKPSLQTYETCNAKNDYLENTLAGVLNQSAYSAFFQSPQKEIIRTACIQRNMEQFSSSSAFYRLCRPQQLSGGAHVRKACLSDNYVNMTSKSFNLAAECLGDYVAGSSQGKAQAALSVFAFMAQESGMHVNARSNTGAGGPGQMTGGAIAEVNKDLRNIRRHLAKSNNPNCSQVLTKALETPLTTRAEACDRLSVQKDNPIKSMAYAFAYQAFIRRSLSKVVFDEDIFGSVLSPELPREQRDRLMMELSAWSHNTGPTGMTGTYRRAGPLIALLRHYAQNKYSVKTEEDVSQFMAGLKPFMRTHAHPANSSPGRYLETGNYYENIQKKMKLITQEPKSCLAI